MNSVFFTNSLFRVKPINAFNINNKPNCNNFLLKKYKLLKLLKFYDKQLCVKYEKAKDVCYNNIPIDEQYECKKLWRELETITIIKKEIEKSLEDINNDLSKC
jgi:hypothetical protein|uniref:Uncharacterized protein n=1 Tax=viral metagenome TaxID=1070528 RepID=A0A6C0BPR4_9ZZZZ